MRATRRLTGLTGAAAVLAMVCGATAGATAAGSASADEPVTTTEVTNDDIVAPYTPEYGCLPGRDEWFLCAESQGGASSYARVTVDDTEPLHHDGSLLVATPHEGDKVTMDYFLDRNSLPRFSEWSAGSLLMKVVRGESPTYTVDVRCGGGRWMDLTFAGPYPAPGTGWQTVDLVQGGRAPWTARGSTEARSLSDHQASCVDGEIDGQEIALSTPGAAARVDQVRLADRVTNFTMPWLTRPALYPYAPTTLPGVERQHARFLSNRSFDFLGDGDPSGLDPNRARNPQPSATVIASQRGWRSALVAAPLADALGAPLLLDPAGGAKRLDQVTEGSLSRSRPTSKRVYLVGLTGEFSRSIDAVLRREMRLEVVHVEADDPYALAVKVARMVDRHRPAGVRARVLLTSGTTDDASWGVAAAASRTRGAVLLTRGSRMPRATKRYLAQHPRASVFAVGRAAATARPRLRPDHRIVGSSAFDTAVKVARRFFPAPRSVVLVPEASPRAAAIGGVYARRTNAPVLPVRAAGAAPVVRDWLRSHRASLHDSVLLADEARVPVTTFEALERLLTPTS